MIDVEKLTSRDILLEKVYTSLPIQEAMVTASKLIPEKRVETESVIIPDISMPIFEVNGKWVYGAEVPTYFKSTGSETQLRVKWYAIKDSYIPQELKAKVAPEIQKATEVELLGNMKRVIALAKEIDFHTLATTTSNYATGFWATPATKWDATSPDIIGDIQTGINKLLDIGIRPDLMIIPLKVWNKIKFSDQFKNMYVDRNYATPQFLKDLFEIPNILMPSVTTFGKPKKGTPTATNLWQDDVIITSTQPLGAGTYPAFVKATLQPALIQRLPIDQETLTQTIIAREAIGYNFIKNNAAYLLHDVLS